MQESAMAAMAQKQVDTYAGMHTQSHSHLRKSRFTVVESLMECLCIDSTCLLRRKDICRLWCLCGDRPQLHRFSYLRHERHSCVSDVEGVTRCTPRYVAGCIGSPTLPACILPLDAAGCFASSFSVRNKHVIHSNWYCRQWIRVSPYICVSHKTASLPVPMWNQIHSAQRLRSALQALIVRL